MNDASCKDTTVGILYAGEMGSSLGRLLVQGGVRVVTTTQGRSARTRSLCHEAGLEVLPSIDDVVGACHILLSVVPPRAAYDVAEQVAQLAALPDSLMYVDLNSVSPACVERIAAALGRRGGSCVDASIFGLAAQIRERGTVCLSGEGASTISALFAPLLPTRIVGAKVGQASALKMILSGLPKGLSALIIEIMLLAQQMEMLDDAVDMCNLLYPEIMAVASRMLPTYPQHAKRRSEELAEVETTMIHAGLKPRMLTAAREITTGLADLHWGDDKRPQRWPLMELMREIQRETSLYGTEEASTDAPDQAGKDSATRE